MTSPHAAIGSSRYLWPRFSIIGFASGLALLGLAGIASFVDAQRLADTMAEVEETRNILSRFESISLNIERAVSIGRIFVLIGDEDIIAPLEQAELQISDDLTVLHQMLLGEPDQLLRLASLDEMIGRRLTQTNEYIGVRRLMETQQAIDAIPAGGEQLATEIRTLMTEMEQVEQLRLQQRQTGAAANHANTLSTLILFNSASLLFFLLASIAWSRQATSRRKAEKDLRLNESRLKDAERIGRVGGWDWDVAMGELAWTDETYRIFGVDRETFTPTFEAFLAAVHPNDQAAVRAAVNHSVTSGGAYDVQLDIVRPDGTKRTVHAEGEITLDQDGKAMRMIGAIRDVTEQRKLEEQLNQAQKMEVVGQLTGGIAHDFNNLLTVILGNLQLIEEPSKKDESLHASVQAALDAGFRGTELTKRLLAFSRQQMLAPEVIDINQLVMEIESLLKRSLGEEITLTIRPGEDLWFTEIDPSQLENSLVNLAINARDAMPGGGTLTVETANTTVAEAYAGSHGEVPPGEYVLVTVNDTGTGMSEEVMKNIFEPFFTTKEFGKGSGLGLSMVHGFVTQSKGYINVDSQKEGHGVTFRLYLPRERSATEAMGTTSTRLKGIAGGQDTILVVEDQTAVRRIATKLLESLGYRVLEADDGAEALILLNAHEDVDLLFTDMVMPGGMSGAELADQARQHRPDLKVLYTSGYTESRILGSDVALSTEFMLNKPYPKEELAQAIREALD